LGQIIALNGESGKGKEERGKGKRIEDLRVKILTHDALRITHYYQPAAKYQIPATID
jgi:hypothetical protein